MTAKKPLPNDGEAEFHYVKQPALLGWTSALFGRCRLSSEYGIV